LLERKKKWHSARRTAAGKTRAITDRPYKKSAPIAGERETNLAQKNCAEPGAPEKAKRRRSYDRRAAFEEQRSYAQFFQAKTAPAEPCDPSF